MRPRPNNFALTLNSNMNELYFISMKSELYPRPGIEGTYKIAFDEAARQIRKRALTGRVLDFGCGWGRSSSFLAELGFEVTGVDINIDLLAAGGEMGFPSCLIKDSKLPFSSNSFDLTFSSFTFVDFSSKEQLRISINEVNRVLKNGGFLMVIQPTVESYRGRWSSFNCNFPENENLVSGDRAKVQMEGSSEVSCDYIWSDNDLELLFKQGGFQIVEKTRPAEEGKSAWVVYLLRKG